MTRYELYIGKWKNVQRKGSLIFLFFGIILLSGLLIFQHYYHRPVQTASPDVNPGKKVVVHLPNGNEVYTYANYIVHKNGKTFYKGEGDTDTIDLTGGTISYQNWK